MCSRIAFATRVVRFSRGIPFQMRLLSPLVECSFKSLSAMVSPIMPVPLMAVNGCQMSDVCHHLIIQSSSILAAFMSTTYLCLCLSRTPHDSTLPALLLLRTCSPSFCPSSTHVCVRCGRSSDDQPNCKLHVCHRCSCLSSQSATQEGDELLELKHVIYTSRLRPPAGFFTTARSMHDLTSSV